MYRFVDCSYLKFSFLMQFITSSSDLSQFLSEYRKKHKNNKIGFVPTMGALHSGHLELIRQANEKSDLVICSIFVNPTQFNNKTDLEKYPRTLEKDLDLLRKANCDLVFHPSEEDIYPLGYKENYSINLNGLDLVMEGEFRPGHFRGVAMIVERFFRIIEPNFAFFGKKDFQQLAIIKHLVKERDLKLTIVGVETKRSEEGLALSSRNQLLSEQEKKEALIIFQTLQYTKENFSQFSNKELEERAKTFFNQGNLKLEYLNIVGHDDLRVSDSKTIELTCCIAAYCGNVRLIDNLQINS